MNKKRALNLGCGLDYRKSESGINWINLDVNKDYKAEVYSDINKKLPFKDNYFDYIYTDNVLEHVGDIFKVMDELWRICKDGAIIEIYTPHASGMYCHTHLGHKNFFGIDSFSTMEVQASYSEERYNKARFQVLKQKLLFFHHNLYDMKFLSKLPINWIFNFSHLWQKLMERFQFFGFDEIKYKLRVVKSGKQR